MVFCKNSLALFPLELSLPNHSFERPRLTTRLLNAHNQARAAVGVGPMTWDNNVAAFARNYANQRAVTAILCIPAIVLTGRTLRKAAVVWHNSVRLGCAKMKCNNGGTFIGCNNDPPGNFDGQRPY
ncbi:hypothetical protein GH714_008615 [Hevea brasiliensis]|uniref:SCP domain-containing protein n=1 Tax=Hevea brasiliensis TaxID=3981 RepID=A0A6A6L281_HEVBR|nr:hypothetical protein GH714_008615 [Hevea brasiliensis]